MEKCVYRRGLAYACVHCLHIINVSETHGNNSDKKFKIVKVSYNIEKTDDGLATSLDLRDVRGHDKTHREFK